MKVGILGLGLIGGSLARAYALEGHTVFAAEKDESILSFAILAGAVQGRLDEQTIPQCDLILLAIYPGGSAAWLEENAPRIRQTTLVLDCCGIKKGVLSIPMPQEHFLKQPFPGAYLRKEACSAWISLSWQYRCKLISHSYAHLSVIVRKRACAYSV